MLRGEDHPLDAAIPKSARDDEGVDGRKLIRDVTLIESFRVDPVQLDAAR